jgi:hypothetical protein
MKRWLLSILCPFRVEVHAAGFSATHFAWDVNDALGWMSCYPAADSAYVFNRWGHLVASRRVIS